MSRRSFLAFGLALALAACGTTDPMGTPDAASDPVDASLTATIYFPYAIGASWTYQVTDPLFPSAPPTTKVQTVEAFEDVGGEKAGVVAFRLKTVRPGREVITWQVNTPAGLAVRHREKEFDVVGESSSLRADNFFLPYKLRVDGSEAHVAAGVTWDTMHDEHIFDASAPGGKTISKTERWTVEAVGEMVTVPAGTFSTIRVRRQVIVGAGGDPGADKTFWFTEGVGKIKESGGQIEELASYSLP
jgi:hypothetical protein